MSIENNVSLNNLYQKEIFSEPSGLMSESKEIDKNALEILKMRYYIDLPDGQKETNFSQLCRRVARIIASGEYKENMLDSDLNYILNIENSIYNDMMSHRFLFNSPALFSAGTGISSNKNLCNYLYKSLVNESYEEIRETYEKISKNYNKNQMMFACFTIEVPDSIDGIFDSVKNAAIISKFGGGVGANFGNLREKGALIAGGCGGKASGPISFMQNWNTMGSTVVQGGKRRAALMGILNTHHPDIEDFISCKENDGSLSYFNISVAIDNKFMDAVKNNGTYDLRSPDLNQVVKTIKARDLWDKICYNAYKNGDPGLFFIDLANEDNILKNDKKYYIESTNPCLVGDTLVSTIEGEKRIDEITTDDYVLTLDPEIDDFSYGKVEFSGRTRINADIIELEIENGKTLRLTPDHKVFIENDKYRGYAEAKNLTKNDSVIILNDYHLNETLNSKVKGIKVVENADVYDINVSQNHNFFANGVLVHNCGEQPLPNDSSCNLGSINLSEFVDENNNFKDKEFKDQILRSIYYLDLVIDVTNYPLKKIEKNTKDIRPVGLGVMGLADACIKMGIKYGSKEFEEFSKDIAETLAIYSLIATAAIAKIKEPYPHFDDENGERNYLNSILKDHEITSNNIRELLNDNIDDSNLPISLKNALIKCYYDRSYFINETFVLELFKSIFSTEKYKNGLRNSRRLSIAPTGTISLLLNTSSGIEPNFSYEWTRKVSVSASEKQTLTYYHKLYTEENKENGLLVQAHDVSPEQHTKVVSIFAPYIDSAISKTVNMPNESTVEDVKKVYEYCFDNNIKGITIYRDGSRSEQPLEKTDKKEKLDTEIVEKGKIRSRPHFMRGVTTKSDSPYGSIYVTANFDDHGKMFETFISAGKSGSVSKSITEALSRVISLALRSGVDIKELINTISNISGSEVWVYDSMEGEEIFVKSIPDATSKMLKDLNDYYIMLLNNENFVTNNYNKVKENKSTEKFGHYRNWCPECGAQMMQTSGCSVCPSCGFSDCK